MSDNKTFQLNVATAGTPVQLPANAINSAQAVIIKAKPANTGNVSVGYSSSQVDTDNTNFFSLAAGEAVELTLTNTNQIWIDSTVSGEGVQVLISY